MPLSSLISIVLAKCGHSLRQPPTRRPHPAGVRQPPNFSHPLRKPGRTCRLGFQNGLFCPLKHAVLQSKTARFALQNDPSRNAFSIRQLRKGINFAQLQTEVNGAERPRPPAFPPRRSLPCGGKPLPPRPTPTSRQDKVFIECPQSSYSKELKELQEVIAPLRSAKKLEDVCSFTSLFRSFRLNADIH